MSAHSKYSPSKSERWINCPGSIKLSEQFPEPKTSKHASLGTAAHKLGEYCLRTETFPDAYYGKSINGHKVDDEMIKAIEVYLDEVYACIDSAGECEKSIEQYIDMTHIHPDLGGTCDFVLSTKTKLTVIDYKNGSGHDVDAEENSQGLNYLLGYATGKNRVYKEYEFVIVQPRLDSEDRRIKRWKTTHKYLMKFKEKILDAIQEAESDDPRLSAGNWCTFCPAAGGCPALHNKSLTAASADFVPVSEEINLIKPHELSVPQLLLVLENRKMISQWLKSVEIHAMSILANGGKVGNYKLVRGRSNRKWKDENLATKKLKRLGYKEDDFLQVTIAGPAVIEKLVDKEDLEEVKKLWFKPEGKITIASGDDKREAVVSNAALDFDVIEDEETN